MLKVLGPKLWSNDFQRTVTFPYTAAMVERILNRNIFSICGTRKNHYLREKGMYLLYYIHSVAACIFRHDQDCVQCEECVDSRTFKMMREAVHITF